MNPNTNSEPQRFSITWDERMGYRVSVPCLLLPGQRIEVVEVTKRIVAGTEMDAQQEIEALRDALIWALGNIREGDHDYMRDCGGESQENYERALRVAYPDDPSEW